MAHLAVIVSTMVLEFLHDAKVLCTFGALLVAALCLGFLSMRSKSPEVLQHVLTEAQKKQLQNWDAGKSKITKGNGTKQCTIYSSGNESGPKGQEEGLNGEVGEVREEEEEMEEDSDSDIPDLVDVGAEDQSIRTEFDKALIDQAISAAIAGPKSIDEETLLTLVNRVDDPKIREFIEANGTLSGPNVEMYGRMYAHGDSFEEKGKNREADILHRIAREGFNLMHALAGLLVSQRKPQEAIKLYVKVANIRGMTLGEKHIDTLSSLMCLANLFQSLKMPDQCRSLYTKALSGYEETLGPEHEYTLRCKNNLAAQYCTESKFSEANELFRQILEMQEISLGKDHKDILITLRNLAVANGQLGRYEEAKVLFERALERQKSLFGNVHDETLTTVKNLANVNEQLGRYEEARVLYERAIDGYKILHGEEHQSTIAVSISYAGTQVSIIFVVGNPCLSKFNLLL